ncbi:hypothetical protein COOONC_24733 [Cooperia oncophora]
MVNAELLKKHTSAYKLTRDTAAEYHKQLFTLHPDLAKYYDAEDIDPDRIPKASCVINDERDWRSALGQIKEAYSDFNFPISEFNKVPAAFLAAMEKHAGGVH